MKRRLPLRYIKPEKEELEMNEKFVELIKTLFPPAGKGLKPYEWMVKATPQKEWIAEKGIFLNTAFLVESRPE